MTEQITVPRATWDALINALENHPGNYKLTKSECAAMAEVITAANAVSKFAAARSKRAITDEMLDFDARGLLTSLTFWPHLPVEDADELAEFLAKYMRESAANAVSHPKATEPQAPLGHDGKGCNEVLRMAGKAYPRTCKACGLGPCKWKSAANAVQPQAQGEVSWNLRYADSTPKLNVGHSAFEDWFQQQPFATQTGVKQMCRDSYAAGMGDPLVTYAHPQATEPAEKEDPLQGAVDWLLQADGEFFAVATVQRTLRIGYNRAKRLADIARERAAAPEAP